MTGAAIRVGGLAKEFGGLRAVDGVSLRRRRPASAAC